MRVLLGAFGDPGHAFPIIALGRALRARGHEVWVQTWRRWRADAEAEGLRFEPAPEYHVFPTRERPLAPYEAVARATGETRPLVGEIRPDVVVADILTLAPALAAELEGVPVATVIPHVDPRGGVGFPPYSVGARLPRTAVGRWLWRGTERIVALQALQRDIQMQLHEQAVGSTVEVLIDSASRRRDASTPSCSGWQRLRNRPAWATVVASGLPAASNNCIAASSRRWHAAGDIRPCSLMTWIRCAPA